MEISVIKFDVHDFSTGISEEFIVENNEFMQELVFSHKYTRCIRFDKVFDFQFSRLRRVPQFILEYLIFIDMVDTWNESHSNEQNLDYVDDMVGVY